jgi:hypothetical protein
MQNVTVIDHPAGHRKADSSALQGHGLPGLSAAVGGNLLAHAQVCQPPSLQQDVFYPGARQLSLEQKRDIFKAAKASSFQWWTDILDCSKRFARQRIELTWEEAIGKLDQESLVSVMARVDPSFKPHLEVSYRAMTTPDYFLWVLVPKSKAAAILKKFNLNPY